MITRTVSVRTNPERKLYVIAEKAMSCFNLFNSNVGNRNSDKKRSQQHINKNTNDSNNNNNFNNKFKPASKAIATISYQSPVMTTYDDVCSLSIAAGR